jgi:hypothetical protein
LIYGATGRAGRLVTERALAEGWSVAAFVRNPDKVPEAPRANVTVLKGDLSDGAAVSAAVRLSRRDGIVDASSALPFGHAKGQPANSADRGGLTKATVGALETDGRVDACVSIIVGGQVVPEPGGTIEKWSVAALAWLLRQVFARTMWRETEALLRWCFQEAPQGFRFVYARMGQVLEQPPRGTLRAEQPTKKSIQHGSVSYADVSKAARQRLWRRAGRAPRRSCPQLASERSPKRR